MQEYKLFYGNKQPVLIKDGNQTYFLTFDIGYPGNTDTISLQDLKEFQLLLKGRIPIQIDLTDIDKLTAIRHLLNEIQMPPTEINTFLSLINVDNMPQLNHIYNNLLEYKGKISIDTFSRDINKKTSTHLMYIPMDADVFINKMLRPYPSIFYKYLYYRVKDKQQTIVIQNKEYTIYECITIFWPHIMYYKFTMKRFSLISIEYRIKILDIIIRNIQMDNKTTFDQLFDSIKQMVSSDNILGDIYDSSYTYFKPFDYDWDQYFFSIHSKTFNKYYPQIKPLVKSSRFLLEIVFAAEELTRRRESVNNDSIIQFLKTTYALDICYNSDTDEPIIPKLPDSLLHYEQLVFLLKNPHKQIRVENTTFPLYEYVYLILLRLQMYYSSSYYLNTSIEIHISLISFIIQDMTNIQLQLDNNISLDTTMRMHISKNQWNDIFKIRMDNVIIPGLHVWNNLEEFYTFPLQMVSNDLSFKLMKNITYYGNKLSLLDLNNLIDISKTYDWNYSALQSYFSINYSKILFGQINTSLEPFDSFKSEFKTFQDTYNQNVDEKDEKDVTTIDTMFNIFSKIINHHPTSLNIDIFKIIPRIWIFLEKNFKEESFDIKIKKMDVILFHMKSTNVKWNESWEDDFTFFNSISLNDFDNKYNALFLSLKNMITMDTPKKYIPKLGREIAKRCKFPTEIFTFKHSTMNEFNDKTTLQLIEMLLYRIFFIEFTNHISFSMQSSYRYINLLDILLNALFNLKDESYSTIFSEIETIITNMSIYPFIPSITNYFYESKWDLKYMYVKKKASDYLAQSELLKKYDLNSLTEPYSMMLDLSPTQYNFLVTSKLNPYVGSRIYDLFDLDKLEEKDIELIGQKVQLFSNYLEQVSKYETDDFSLLELSYVFMELYKNSITQLSSDLYEELLSWNEVGSISSFLDNIPKSSLTVPIKSSFLKSVERNTYYIKSIEETPIDDAKYDENTIDPSLYGDIYKRMIPYLYANVTLKNNKTSKFTYLDILSIINAYMLSNQLVTNVKWDKSSILRIMDLNLFEFIQNETYELNLTFDPTRQIELFRREDKQLAYNDDISIECYIRIMYSPDGRLFRPLNGDVKKITINRTNGYTYDIVSFLQEAKLEVSTLSNCEIKIFLDIQSSYFIHLYFESSGLLNITKLKKGFFSKIAF